MIDDKKIEAAKEEIYEDRFLLNGEEIVFNNDEKEEMFYEGDIVMHKDNNAERRGDINWDSKAAAFCFGQDFLFYYSSEDMVVVGNKYDK